MRVLIFGANGMLGHKLYQYFRPQYDEYAIVRSDFGSIKRFAIFEKRSVVGNIDVTDYAAIRRAVEFVRPNCVINAE